MLLTGRINRALAEGAAIGPRRGPLPGRSPLADLPLIVLAEAAR
ncbi:hypothetical protein A8924_6223 [Saccharopolyspora erythraea NRRL 2338]|nr:hypothetical protein N599_00460 [Saccharopolyspora erythraea D]PFG98701.1 hypothetical protein A8924_6223 [Saccharopolyspora erythraea NRRL 2338]